MFYVAQPGLSRTCSETPRLVTWVIKIRQSCPLIITISIPNYEFLSGNSNGKGETTELSKSNISRNRSKLFRFKINGLTFKIWSRGYTTFFVLNSAKHELLTAHKYKITLNNWNRQVSHLSADKC